VRAALPPLLWPLGTLAALATSVAITHRRRRVACGGTTDDNARALQLTLPANATKAAAEPRALQSAAALGITLRPSGACLVEPALMNWLVWLGLAVVIAAIAAVTGFKPKGTRHVAHTRMMGAGRIALLIMVIIFAYLAYRARAGV
jgi:hypothetical protein